MTNHTDSSKEIEIPKEFIEWAENTAEEPPSDWPFGVYSYFVAAQIRMAGAVYRHLRPSPSPGGWIEIKPGCEMPETIEGKDYSGNVFVICDGKLEVMSYGWVDAEPEGGWVWSNCYGDIRGDSEWDDEYKPTHWMPLPKPPIPGDK
jgi:hypothetical protein